MLFANKNVFSRYFEKFNWSNLLDDVFSKLVSLVLLLALFYLAKKLVHVLVRKIISPSLKLSSQDEGRQKTLTRLIENLLNYTLYFFLIYWILAILGLPVSSLLAGAGIAGVAIGMGAQGFLSDLVTNGSIKIAGTVVSVGIRTTQVRDADGTLHYVPNRNITVVSNLSRGNMRALIDIPLYAQTDLEKVTRIIQQVNEEYAGKQTEILQEPTILGPQVSENGQFYFRISITVQSGSQSTVYHQFYRLYHDALLKEGIDLPTIYAPA